LCAAWKAGIACANPREWTKVNLSVERSLHFMHLTTYATDHSDISPSVHTGLFAVLESGADIRESVYGGHPKIFEKRVRNWTQQIDDKLDANQANKADLLTSFENGQQFTLEFVQRNGISKPIILHDKLHTGMCIPAASFTVMDVCKVCLDLVACRRTAPSETGAHHCRSV
jgi:hypothetical protein